MRGVDQTPPLIDLEMGVEPRHRPLATPCETLLHLPGLFGNMNMDGTVSSVRESIQHLAQQFFADRPQRMQREAGGDIGVVAAFFQKCVYDD